MTDVIRHYGQPASDDNSKALTLLTDMIDVTERERGKREYVYREPVHNDQCEYVCVCARIHCISTQRTPRQPV